MSTNELTAKIKGLRELRRMAEELAAEIESIQDSIKAEMTARAVDELAGADFRITWKPVTTNRFDSKALKAAMPELYSRFTSATTTRRFVVM